MRDFQNPQGKEAVIISKEELISFQLDGKKL
jgi:PHD/YefM family antitoxin component YafN of YafNO toxin-antitoxin module